MTICQSLTEEANTTHLVIGVFNVPENREGVNAQFAKYVDIARVTQVDRDIAGSHIQDTLCGPNVVTTDRVGVVYGTCCTVRP